MQQKILFVARRLQPFAENKWFQRLYPIFGLAVLLASTTFWSLLGARVHQQNADQLVNPYLFENAHTFQNALLPGSHSFLLKWPLFWLIKLFGYTPAVYTAVTVGIVLATVAAFAYILYRIERRPVVYGTILLALASVLMLVPTTSYAGALLPVNMAMLTTRNIEYIVFIVSIALIIRARQLRTPSLWIGIGLLAALIASDKLFLSLSLGGAVFALLAYGFSTGWNTVKSNARWVFAALISGIGATAALWLISTLHITHIISGEGVGPYGIVHNIHDLVLGTAYGALHILTNFGANPASQTVLLQSVPHDALRNFMGWSLLAYTMNFIVFVIALIGAYHLLRRSWTYTKDETSQDTPVKLSIALIWTSAAACGVFVVSSHYYAADARYLTIVFFSLFLAAVTYLSRKQLPTLPVIGFGVLCFVGIVLAVPNVISSYRHNQAVLKPITERNERISEALTRHKVTVLVGDYWRVIPIKSMANRPLTVTPLTDCTTSRNTLSSTAWEPDLTKNSFAYLLTLDGSATDFPHCTLENITSAYGKPDASIVIAGTKEQPKELILFYDHAGRGPAHR